MSPLCGASSASRSRSGPERVQPVAFWYGLKNCKLKWLISHLWWVNLIGLIKYLNCLIVSLTFYLLGNRTDSLSANWSFVIWRFIVYLGHPKHCPHFLYTVTIIIHFVQYAYQQDSPYHPHHLVRPWKNWAFLYGNFCSCGNAMHSGRKQISFYLKLCNKLPRS